MGGPGGAPEAREQDFLLHAPSLDRPILFCDAGEVADTLARITLGWDWSRGPAGPDAAGLAAVRIGRDAEGYGVDSDWLEAPFLGLSPVAAACSTACDLGLAHLDADLTRVGLHCGAVAIGGRLVVLAGARRAGKSTLVVRLGADGHRVFTDDILPLGPGPATGIALGVAPRLRLPLPRGSRPGFRAHVAAHLVARDARYGYVMPPALAPRGEEAPVGVVVLLDRRTRGRARLRNATRAEALHRLVLRNLAADRDPGALLDRLERLVVETEVFWLEYADLEEAAALIGRAFAPGAGPVATAGPRRAASPARTRRVEPAPAALPDRRYRTRPGIEARDIDGELFLCDPDERAILHLNPVGAAIWSLIAEEANEAEAVGALRDAFPAVDAARIAADVATLFADLRGAALIEAVDEAG